MRWNGCLSGASMSLLPPWMIQCCALILPCPFLVLFHRFLLSKSYNDTFVFSWGPYTFFKGVKKLALMQKHYFTWPHQTNNKAVKTLGSFIWKLCRNPVLHGLCMLYFCFYPQCLLLFASACFIPLTHKYQIWASVKTQQKKWFFYPYVHLDLYVKDSVQNRC